MTQVSTNYKFTSNFSKLQIYDDPSKIPDLISKVTKIPKIVRTNLLFTKISKIRSDQCPKISSIPIDSNRPKEPKSNLHFVKNLTNCPKSTKNNSDENTLRSKLVQKSIRKFLSCPTHSPHQNP